MYLNELYKDDLDKDDLELDKIYNEWEIMEKENMLYHKNRKKRAIILILSFLNIMLNYMIFLIQNNKFNIKNNNKFKNNKQYSVEDID